jgi:hypothetical protein
MIPLSNVELDGIEQGLHLKLPGLYRKLLVELGHGGFNHGQEIYHPSQVQGLYESFFYGPELFNPYFPFGCDNKKQEIWVIYASTERAASIWHETVPDDWDDEEWLQYDLWITRFLER